MNLILLQPQDFIADNTVRLSDERFQHIRKIHKSQPGHQVRLGQINGLMGVGIITSIDDHSVVINVSLDQPPPAKIPLTLILALPRPKMIRRLFRTIVELGVEELIVINSYKVEKSFWQSPALQQEAIDRYLLAGLQQAKDTVVPKVSFKPLFKPFVEDELPAVIANSKALLAHPGAGEHCPHQLDRRLCLAIGPEGGFTDYEVEKLLAAGFQGIHLGERILRVENAVSTLIAKLYS